MKHWMHALFLKDLRNAIDKYDLIRDGERILIGASGGKDSSLLLYALSLLKQYRIYDIDVTGLMANHGMMMPTTQFLDFFKEAGVDVIVHRENFVLNESDKSPCYTCSRMRKGILKRYAQENGYQKIAYGHTKEDVVETFLMNILQHGKIGSISPKQRDEATGITMIRPLLFLDETRILKSVDKIGIPIVESTCRYAESKLRSRSEHLISHIETCEPKFSDQVIKALANIDLNRTLVTFNERGDTCE